MSLAARALRSDVVRRAASRGGTLRCAEACRGSPTSAVQDFTFTKRGARRISARSKEMATTTAALS